MIQAIDVVASAITEASPQHQCSPPPVMQCGPSASWPVVLVPIGGPGTTVPVSTVTSPLPADA